MTRTGTNALGIAMCAVAAAVMASPPGHAQAASCEAARCAVEQVVNERCPCMGAATHGRYVGCVVRIVKELARAGAIPKTCRGKVVRCAARSTCGRSDAVSCWMPLHDTCNIETFTCSENPSLECLSDGDCVVASTCSVTTAEHCAEADGSVSASGTCCGECAAAPLPE